MSTPVAPAARVEQGQWPLDCPLWLLHRPGAPILSAKLWMRGGSGSDAPGERGAAQLLAGVLSRGCGPYSADALADLVEGCGAGLRCEAAEDATLISLKCASDDAATLLPLLLQMVRSPWLVEDQIALERQLNLQTLQRQREDPFQVAHDALREQLYGSGPYGHDPLGVEPDLAALERSHLQTLAAGLGRRGAALVLSGVIPDHTEALLEQSLTAQPWQGGDPGQALPLTHPAPQTSIASCIEDTEQVVLMLGCCVPALADPDNLSLRVLQAHLGLGMSSRLFLRVREELGLAYDVGVHMPARRGPTPFIWHLSTSADRAGEATCALLDEWQRLQESVLSNSELSLAKAKYRGQEAMGRQTCGQIADRQALLLGFGLPEDTIAQAMARSETLEAADLQTVARRHLGAPSLSLCGPRQGLLAAEQAWRTHPLNRPGSS